MPSHPAPDLARYFDYNGSTPVHPELAQLERRIQLECFGNAAASHAEGLRAREAIARAREEVAAGIGARPEEVWFTSGGTESNNWALFGSAAVARGRHLVVSAIEHKSVLRCAEELGRRGYALSIVAPDARGVVPVRALEQALRPDTFLVSLMWANNETGVRQPVREVAELCRARGIRFHTDAVCALGKLSIDARELGCDLLSLSSHKLYAPKGCGVLFVRDGLEIAPLIHGCGQQQGMRSGTENTAGAAAFGRALHLSTRGAFEPPTPYEELRDMLWSGLQARFPGAERNGGASTLANTLNVYIPGCLATDLQSALAQRGFSVAAGAAAGTCSPSHVLTAMGCGDERARGSLRFSLGRHSTRAGVEALLDALVEAQASCRSAHTMEVQA